MNIKHLKKKVMSTNRNTTDFIKDDTKVIVTMKNGKQINGTIVLGRYHSLTFEKIYDVDYYKEDGKLWTMLDVPENAITIC